MKLHFCDQRDLPKWGTGPDGSHVKIDGDERLPGLFAEWRADACAHEETAIVQQSDSLGRSQYIERCTHCGIKLSSPISHEKAKAAGISDWARADMDALEKSYSDERDHRFEQIVHAAAERCQDENRQSYDDYLRSPAWRRRSAKIMQRAKGVCEGCLSNKATEVHHRTYEHLGQEFAFELLALCSPCHRRLHGRAE